VIVGVGIDVVDVTRFAKSLERTPGLLVRLFTETEQGLLPVSLAARFAAKEALAKALGGPSGLLWTDAEVRKAENGRPFLHVQGTVAAAAEEQGITDWHVSLSHDAGIATAVVVAEAR
jgi:holo-[acyl-carrier protein] synthase